jgi:hypothetical protein
VTAVPQDPPGTAYQALDPSHPGAGWRGNVLDEHEPPARPEHPPDLLQRPRHIPHGTEDQRGKHGVDTAVCEWQLFGHADLQPHGDAQAVGLGHQVRFHVAVRFDADPGDIRRQKAEVGTGAGADLEHGTAQRANQVPFPGLDFPTMPLADGRNQAGVDALVPAEPAPESVSGAVHRSGGCRVTRRVTGMISGPVVVARRP